MKPELISIFGTILLIGLLAFFYGSRHQPAPETFWKDTRIACLPNGHQKLAMHIHARMEIFVNGNQESVPAGIGVASDCLAEVHTHQADNVIHIETSAAGEEFTLGDFYRVWEQSIDRPDFDLEVFVNDEKVWGPRVEDKKVETPQAVVLTDGEKLRLQYTSAK
jgi:hypothetical protein